MHGVQEENKILFRILNNAWSMKIFIFFNLKLIVYVWLLALTFTWLLWNSTELYFFFCSVYMYTLDSFNIKS